MEWALLCPRAQGVRATDSGLLCLGLASLDKNQLKSKMKSANQKKKTTRKTVAKSATIVDVKPSAVKPATKAELKAMAPAKETRPEIDVRPIAFKPAVAKTAVQSSKATKEVASAPAKTVAATPAPKPVTVSTAPPARETKPYAPAPKVATIEAKINVGFGNNLFVRGNGPGLSWEHGTPLTCVDEQTWRWTATVDSELTFKLLLNDSVWAKGEDVVVEPGERIELAPSF